MKEPDLLFPNSVSSQRMFIIALPEKSEESVATKGRSALKASLRPCWARGVMTLRSRSNGKELAEVGGEGR